MTTIERRVRALERHYGPAMSDPALNDRVCRFLAAELGIEPAELWAEAEACASEAARYPSPEAYAETLAAEFGITVAELMADTERIVARALAGEGTP